MGSGASKTKSLATDENLKKAATVAKTVGAVANAVGDGEGEEGEVAALGALGNNLTGGNATTSAAGKAGAKAIGGEIEGNVPEEAGSFLKKLAKIFSFAKKAKSMKDQLDVAAADGELDLGEIAQAAQKSGVLGTAAGAGGAKSLTNAAQGAVGDVEALAENLEAELPEVEEPEIEVPEAEEG